MVDFPVTQSFGSLSAVNRLAWPQFDEIASERALQINANIFGLIGIEFRN